MRNIIPTQEQVNTVNESLLADGVANFKGTEIVKTNKGWFKDSQDRVFAESLEELMYDINELQTSFEYDKEIKAQNEFKCAFNNALV